MAKDDKHILDFIFMDFLSEDSNENMVDEEELIKKLQLIVNNGYGIRISAVNDVSYKHDIDYRTMSVFMINHNKKLKDNVRKCMDGEPGSNRIYYGQSKELIKLCQSSLERGIYCAYLGKKEKQKYAILIVKFDLNDPYVVSSDLFLIGKKIEKYKEEYYKLREKNEKITDVDQTHTIFYVGGPKNTGYKETIFKPFDKLIFENKEKILQYIDRWLENIPTYYKYGIEPKLSILLHGKPGTGKSSFYKALALYLDLRRVLSLSPQYFYCDESMNLGRYNSMIAIDDIDCVATTRDEKTDKDNMAVTHKLLSFLDTPDKFDFKARDGVYYPVSIVVATTNYYDKLDPAVKRAGRFDLTIEMHYFDRNRAEEMCALYDMKLEDVIKGEITDDFEISPAELQALCIEKIDSRIKDGITII